ncbi:MAG TPA: signal peptidase I [Candidatus Paceibacterota bacterium]
MNTENDQISAEQSPISPEKKKSRVKDIVKEIIIFFLIVFGVVLPFRIYIAEPYLVDVKSMNPTFETADYLIVDKFSYRKKSPERNTVIVFKYPNQPSKNFIKRIIGLPGETVVMKEDTIKIINSENPDGFEIDQSYVTHKMPGNFTKTLAGDEYFVMGDNRPESFDSRSWGPLKKEFILGKPVLRLWPISKIGILPGEDKK